MRYWFLSVVCLSLLACTGSRPAGVRYSDTLAATYPFVYPAADSPYLTELRQRYRLDTVGGGATDDLQTVLALLNWTHRQWSHNGSNVPSKSDALTILAEAATGQQFRCVEYGIVSRDALASRGYRARVLALKTAKVETTRQGAGHVLAEVWLPQYQKWALIDGQFNVLPLLNDRPLNAVELRAAWTADEAVQLVDQRGSLSERRANNYRRFLNDYLYFLDVGFDQRSPADRSARQLYDQKTGLMLVPLGAAEPRVFQRKSPIDHLVYTHSAAAFYAAPNAE